MIAIMTAAQLTAAKPDLPSGTILGTPITAVDGRVAVCHGFDEIDQQYLIAKGAALYDSLPADFVLPDAEASA